MQHHFCRLLLEYKHEGDGAFLWVVASLSEERQQILYTPISAWKKELLLWFPQNFVPIGRTYNSKIGLLD